MGRVLDQGGQPQRTLARTITDDRPEKDPIQRTEASHLVIRFNPGFESRSFSFPTSCLFHYIRQFHPTVFRCNRDLSVH
jgi:hypothetical protein